MVEFVTTPSTEQCGLFTVLKKSGKLRLVVDARKSNCWFAPPAPIALCTGASFADLDVPDPDKPLFIGHLDICDAFWQFELPVGLRHLFGLPSVTASV